jgi:hypothetical protein
VKPFAVFLTALMLIALTSALWGSHNAQLRKKVNAQADIISDQKNSLAAKYYEVHSIREERNDWVRETNRLKQKGG